MELEGMELSIVPKTVIDCNKQVEFVWWSYLRGPIKQTFVSNGCFMCLYFSISGRNFNEHFFIRRYFVADKERKSKMGNDEWANDPGVLDLGSLWYKLKCWRLTSSDTSSPPSPASACSEGGCSHCAACARCRSRPAHPAWCPGWQTAPPPGQRWCPCPWLCRAPWTFLSLVFVNP